MFPNYLDDAKVLEYTEKGHFGFITDYDGDNNPIEKELCYFAIAQYDGDCRFYLFGCGDTYEVLTDSLWNSSEECKKGACYLPQGIVFHQK